MKKISEALKNIAQKKEKSQKDRIKEIAKKIEKKEEEKKKEVVKKIKSEKKRKTRYEQNKRFSEFLKKAGIESDLKTVAKKIAITTGVIVGILLIYVMFRFITMRTRFLQALVGIFSFGIVSALVTFIVIWAMFFVFVDLRAYKRIKEIEAVFPDFLLLTSANISAGMPIDRALWFAIRPRFGTLAKEMEKVAKATMVGEKLETALMDFSKKYDSLTIKRSLNLLLEGLDSGGEIGELLRKIADNIRQTEIQKKEMASSVTTYVIFILFATLGAAPFLFGLTTELIVIMTSILGSISIGESGSSFGGMSGLMSGGTNTISLGDYQLFAMVSLIISSTFAAIIISTIQKGNAKEAIKQIPFYVGISLGLYFVAFRVLHYLLGGLIQ